jgi:hypothetical protein
MSLCSLSTPGLGLEKHLRDSCPEKIGGGLRPGRKEFRRCHSLYHMKIAMNLADLNSEQTKFLSQLGTFRDDATWEAGCDPDEFEEAVNLLKRAGIEDVFVQFGN